jgi:hypothetical protein
MLKTGDANDIKQNEMVVSEKAPPADDKFDTIFQIGLNGYRSVGIGDNHSTSMGSFSSSWHYDPRNDRKLDETDSK